jgi:hypothetical protein
MQVEKKSKKVYHKKGHTTSSARSSRKSLLAFNADFDLKDQHPGPTKGKAKHVRNGVWPL